MTFDPRRLAALDLVGARGTALRRRLVFAEFVGSAVAGMALGGWFLTAGRPIAWFVGLWCLGVGVNYAALAAHALLLLRPGRIATELAAVPDLKAEARRYGIGQLRLVIPFLVAGIAVTRMRRRPGSS